MKDPALKVLASDDEVPQAERAAEQSMAERFCVLLLSFVHMFQLVFVILRRCNVFFWQPPVRWVMGCSYMFHWRCWGRKHKKTWQAWKRKHLETSGNMEVFCGPWSWIWGQAETRYQHFTQFQRICQCSDALPGDLNPKTVGMESNRLPWNHPWKWSLILKVLQVQQYQTWREKNVLVTGSTHKVQ